MLPALSEFADRHPIATGLVGTATSFGSATAGGALETVSVWLSIATQTCGLLVGIMTVCLTWSKFSRWLREMRRARRRVDSTPRE